MKVVNEPTAAAVAFGIDKTESADDRNCIIIDLGGGTFDVTVLCMDGGIMEVKSTNGDTHLGGADFDQEIVEACKEGFKQEFGHDITKNARAMRRLKTEAENAKKVLTNALSVDIIIDCLAEGEDLNFTLSRVKFE